jgi:hypothetical protein
VDRQCFDDADTDPNFHVDADPDPDQHQNDADHHANPTQSFTNTENKEKIKITLYYSFASLQCLIFLISVKGVMIFSIFDSILKFSEKSKVYQLFDLSGIDLSGSDKMMRIRPHPDPQEC